MAHYSQLAAVHVPLPLLITFSSLIYRFLDVGLPLWLGGAPSVPAGLPLGSRGIDGCVRNVIISGVMLDLASHVDERNSANRCPQVLLGAIYNSYTCILLY